MVDIFPSTPVDTTTLGVVPVDFMLETVLQAGITWFKTTTDSEKKVYGWLTTPYLSSRYGAAKALEIKDFIVKYDIKIVQSFALIDQTVPSISIQLLDANEMTERASFQDFEKVVDQVDINNNILARNEISYSPIGDNIHIGIHVQNTPDLAKYIYYLVVYILNTFKPKLEEQGLMLGTFRATDISKLNEFLPENIFSRFLNFSVYSPASFDRGEATIIENIIGVSSSQFGTDIITDPNFEYGIKVETIGAIK